MVLENILPVIVLVVLFASYKTFVWMRNIPTDITIVKVIMPDMYTDHMARSLSLTNHLNVIRDSIIYGPDQFEFHMSIDQMGFLSEWVIAHESTLFVSDQGVIIL